MVLNSVTRYEKTTVNSEDIGFCKHGSNSLYYLCPYLKGKGQEHTLYT
jgi:hypothetical protein